YTITRSARSTSFPYTTLFRSDRGVQQDAAGQVRGGQQAMRHTLDVVVGAQYGSEAKGHCVQALAGERLESGGSLDVVRVAGPNAGHTGYDQQGRKWALRQVPVAAVVPGPINLRFGPGSEVDLPVMLAELDRLRDAGLLDDKTVQVSSEATLIDEAHKRAEANSNLVSRVGSTGKGIGAARA